MSQNYQIFFNKSLISIAFKEGAGREVYFSNLQNPIRLSEKRKFKAAFKAGLLEIEHGSMEELDILSNDPKAVFKAVKSCFDEYIKAGGGIVRNSMGEILFIFRKKKWDLPKGKIEKGETIKEGARREVMEECGIEQLKVRQKIATTFHAYEMKQKSVLKKTNWYLMFSDATQFTPQQEEDISKVRWIKSTKMKKVYKNTYRNIKSLLKGYLGESKNNQILP
ncbi:MAG: NUDIX domain-containing protein [Chitinophagales bacterium]